MPEPNNVKDRRILIVDDEQSIREALQLFFEGRGYATKQAENGLDALKLIEKEDFDLVLSDIRMNKMGGVDLIKRMDRYDKKTPVIFITAYPEVNSAIEAIKHGVVEYITKPFEMKDLELKVREALKKKYDSSEVVLNEKYIKQKKNFLSRFSHELRAPLTPVAAYVKLLLKKEFGEIPPRQAEIIKKIEKNSKRLKKVSDDLIMLYAIENAGESLDVKPCNLNDILRQSVEEEDMFIREKKDRVEVKVYDGLETINCDEQKMQKVLFHLIDNAVKFSPVASEITVSVRKFFYDGNKYIKFSVRDGSERLRDINKRLLFRKFYDMTPTVQEQAASNAGGLGLGLTLSKLIVEAHRGKIWLEEGEDKTERGNIFSFILPEA